MLKKVREDTARATILNAISEEFLFNKEFEKSTVYANEALALAQKLNFKKGIAAAHRAIGINLTYQGHYREAINHHSAALKLNEQLDDKRGIARYYQDIGLVCYFQDDDPGALKNYYKALKLFEQIDDLPSMGRTLTHIGGAYYYLKNFSEAKKNYLKALKIDEQIGSRDGIAYSIKSLAIAGFNQGNTAYDAGDRINAKKEYTAAIEKHLEAIKIYEELESKPGILETYPHLGDVYEKLGTIALDEGDLPGAKSNFLVAQKYNLEFLKIAEELNDENYITEACNRLGSIHIRLKNFSIAEKFLERGLALSVKRKFKVTIRDAYERLSALDSCKGDFVKALGDYKMFILYRDSLVNEEITRRAESYKMQYEFDKKEDQVKLLTTENKLQSTLAGKENQKKKFAYLGIGAILLAGGYGFYRYRRKNKLENIQSVMNERLRISRELHDEVGATLSGIAMYSHLANEQIRNSNTMEVQKSLNIMQQSSGEMVNKLNDIVWLINPEQDSLQKLIERLEEYATNMASIKNMQVKINAPERISQLSLPVDSRRNIYLFCKEAINNAVKYSAGSLLELNIKEANGKLEFSVSDNGKGFDAVMVRKGNGLDNMQQRADEMGAKLVLRSKADEGVFVSMQCISLK